MEKVEEEIFSYLLEYGNTRKTDIISYLKRIGYSLEKSKKTIKQLITKNKIQYVFHNKLKTPEVYITLKEPLTWVCGLKTQLSDVDVQVEKTEDDVKKILEEAAALAEKQSKEM